MSKSGAWIAATLFGLSSLAQNSSQKPIQWPPTSLDIQVKFSDGTVVPLTLRSDKSDWWQPDPTQDGPANVARLVPLANKGDMGAAFGLSQFLNDCKSGPLDEAQMNGWIKDLREKNLLTWRQGETTPLPAGQTPERQEKYYRDKFRRCKGLKPADFATADQWQRKAAAGGHRWALTYLYQDNNSGLSPEQKLEVARKSWEFGDIGGLDRVSRQLADVNRVESVAYLVLADRITAAMVEAADNGSTRFGSDYASRRLAGELRELTPDERKRAETMAKSILQKNKNCCYVN